MLHVTRYHNCATSLFGQATCKYYYSNSTYTCTRVLCLQGDAAKPGELWGLWNLLRFSGQTVETRDILQAHAYKGRQRQQVEQQLQHDLQQKRQQPNAQVGYGGDPAAAATAAATTTARPKPFQIIVLDQLVGSADDAGGVEELLLDDADTAAAAAGGAKHRSKQAQRSRKRRGSEDSAGGDAAEGLAAADAVTQRVPATGGPTGAAADVGGIAASGDAWCDEALLQGLLDNLEPDDSSGQQQQRAQALRKRQRRRTIISDDSDDERDDVSQAEPGAAHGSRHRSRPGDVTGRELSPVPEDVAESAAEVQDSMGAGSGSEGPGVSTGSAGVSGGSSEGYLQPVAAVDPVLAALEQQGAILHAHRHEQVRGDCLF
jgi:hypothetical protein